MAAKLRVLIHGQAKEFEFLAIQGRLSVLERRIFPKGEQMDIGGTLKKRNMIVFIVESSENILGYLLLQTGSGVFVIVKLAVNEAHRRMGVGSWLVEAALKYCLQRNVSCQLHVATFRQVAVNLYTKHGFEMKALIKNYYGANRDAFVMKYE